VSIVMAKDIKNFYFLRVQELETKISDLGEKLKTLALARLFVFIIFLSLAIVLIFLHHYLLLLATIMFLLVFLWLVRKHRKQGQLLATKENLLLINQNELQVLEGAESAFNDNFLLKKSHSLSRDLDLIGVNSLFNFIYRGVFNEGKIAFADDLTESNYDSEQLISTQNAHKELAENIKFRQNFLAYSLKHPSTDLHTKSAISNLKQSALPSKNINKRIIQIIALINCSLIGYFGILGQWGLVGLFALIPWAVTGFLGKYLVIWQKNLSKTTLSFATLKTLLNLVKKESFNSPYLNSLQERSIKHLDLISSIKKLSNSFDRKLNGAAYLFNNTLFFSDVLLTLKCQEIESRIEEVTPENFGNLGEWEKLNSMANFKFNNPSYSTPEFSESLSISTENMGHPLIQQEIMVSNDFSSKIAPQTYLITGSNMSGKSTFLRALGINQVLALMGGVVCASKFSTPIIPVLSHLRVDDSLNQQTSYFKAELDRLKSILDNLKSGPALVLIDEMLRGTNSDDKMMGSQKYIERISKIPSLTFVATHDLSLGNLTLSHENINNICFESEIREDNLFFDYLLKPGIAKNKNATWLMQKMDIIP
jgi:hypothetical protein